MGQNSLSPENEKPGIIKDHLYIAPLMEPWGRCIADGCGLAEAAHVASQTPYSPEEGTPYRCPDCVTKGVDPCVHDSH